MDIYNSNFNWTEALSTLTKDELDKLDEDNLADILTELLYYKIGDRQIEYILYIIPNILDILNAYDEVFEFLEQDKSPHQKYRLAVLNNKNLSENDLSEFFDIFLKVAEYNPVLGLHLLSKINFRFKITNIDMNILVHANIDKYVMTELIRKSKLTFKNVSIDKPPHISDEYIKSIKTLITELNGTFIIN